jgi:hypothetical protein
VCAGVSSSWSTFVVVVVVVVVVVDSVQRPD